MNLLNWAYTQLLDLYRSMTPGSRLATVMLAAVVLLSAGYLAMHETTVQKADLMHGAAVSAVQLPAMEAAFSKANLKDYEIRGTSICVPRGQEPAYMAALVEAKALPLNFGDALRKAINDGTPFDDRRVRDQRIKIATQDELALVIRSMNGIESASVMYDMEARSGFNKDKVVTASVSVKPVGTVQLDESQVASIRNFVAGTIVGLRPENITVLDLNGRTWVWSPSESDNAETSRLAATKQACEQELKAKILNSLCFIPDVTVAVSATFDPTGNAKTQPAGIRSRDDSAERIGQYPNTAATLNGDSASLKRMKIEAADEKTDLPNEKKPLALVPSMARASVGVPMSYFKKIWRERNASAANRQLKVNDPSGFDSLVAEETAKIQRHVAQLLPTFGGEAKPADLVAVTTFQDNSLADSSTAGIGQAVLAWLQQSWAAVCAVLLAAIGLLWLRSMFGGGAAESIEDLHIPERIASTVKEESKIPAPHTRRFHDAGESMREDLTVLVEEDPDTAANVLRNWIGQVG